MITLIDVNEQNWADITALSVHEEQKGFLDSPVGIVARGYIYRDCNARVLGICHEKQLIGLALVKDMDEEPACYDLQQFMIDRRFQNKGYGTEALRLILSRLAGERKYDQVEVCVHQKDAAALRVYEKVGFVDTGYVDEAIPCCLNLVYRFPEEKNSYSDNLISDFSHPLFQAAFKRYFLEMGIHVKDWEGLFTEMNSEGDNAAFVRTAENGNIIGFVQFKPVKFTSCFFVESRGFIREFWVAEEYRHAGHGAALLALAEKHFQKNGIYTSILTTDTAKGFYEKQGYIPLPGCRAKNQLPVMIRHLE